MASCSKALLSSTLEHCSPFFSSSLRPHLSFFRNSSSLGVGGIKLIDSSVYPSISSEEQAKPLSFSVSFRKHICKAAEYKFPDPIPEFADAETEKFRAHLLNKLAKRDIFGNSLEEVVGICTEIFSTFLHSEYGGPGTLLVIPFIDMADTINEQGLPGGPQAARAAVKWAQNHVDKDWKEWTGDTV
ncbi:Protein PLASTID REDOX INSENSITIVE 2 like [Melia azedarach]|uniref:Protein PLASTID REDOX INSENSITIVE 2 like n=1 Tax=Melia azedarach TaxID=155640 RepID=A0ACC1XI34_MELAZ|nr:Protein PLASTID REDOX INSENSITIVE 2 like [Melia azedarach]